MQQCDCHGEKQKRKRKNTPDKNKQEGHDDPESLTRNNGFTVLEIIFLKNLLKDKSSSFGKFSSTLTCPSSNILSQH
jgi:hypothetical protein